MRPTKLQWAMELAQVTAKRSTCLRRQVGCVLLDADGHVLATGYNGVAAGMPHCNEAVQRRVPVNDVRVRKGAFGDSYEFNDQVITRADVMLATNPDGIHFTETLYPNACSGAQSPSGTNLDGCEAVHAEQNALLQCRDVREIDTCVVTVSPCVTCTKMLLNTGCRRIVFADEYPHSSAEALWQRVRGATYGGKDHTDVTTTWLQL